MFKTLLWEQVYVIERGTKKKFWVLMRNRNSDLRIPRSETLPLSHRDSTVSEVCNEVHMTRVLHTARIIDGVMFVDGKIREMGGFELVKEIKKDVFRLVTSVGQRRNSESAWGIEPRTSNTEPELFPLSSTRYQTNNIFLYFFTELKTYYLSYISIYKYHAIDIADPSSMQDACPMNFVIDLAHHGVSVAQW